MCACGLGEAGSVWFVSRRSERQREREMAGEGRTPTPSDDLDVFGKELPLTCECVCVGKRSLGCKSLSHVCVCECVCAAVDMWVASRVQRELPGWCCKQLKCYFSLCKLCEWEAERERESCRMWASLSLLPTLCPLTSPGQAENTIFVCVYCVSTCNYHLRWEDCL